MNQRPLATGDAAAVSRLDDLDEGEVLRRWRRGHHAFFVLIQGLILAHRTLRRALFSGDIDAARDALWLCTELLRGSAAALHLAGDVSTRAYDEVVRPSMSPPNVPEGFSGLHNADHQFLIRQLHSLPALLGDLPARLNHDRQRYLWAIQAVYEAHSHVCDKLVGDAPSMLMSARAKEAPPGSAIIMDRYLKRTMALVDRGH